MSSNAPVRPTRETTDVVGQRIVAQLVDLVLSFALVVAVVAGLAVLVRPARAESARGLLFVGILSLPLYGGLLEGYWNGQTVGKRLVGVAVVDSLGREPTVGQALLRNAPAVLLFSWASTAVALAAIAVDDRNQRVFDSVADTYVVEATEGW